MHPVLQQRGYLWLLGFASGIDCWKQKPHMWKSIYLSECSFSGSDLSC